MEYRKLGKTDLEISLLGFGASPLGNEFGEIDVAEGERAVHFVVSLPSLDAPDRQLVRDVLTAGMTCGRVYCAQFVAGVWGELELIVGAASLLLWRRRRIAGRA